MNCGKTDCGTFRIRKEICVMRKRWREEERKRGKRGGKERRGIEQYRLAESVWEMEEGGMRKEER